MLVFVSCQKDIEPVNESLDPDLVCEDCDINIVKDSDRLTQYNEVVTFSKRKVKTSSSEVLKNTSISFTLRAKLAPLHVLHKGQDVLLNANHVTVSGKKVAASYSLVGEPYSGAVDVLFAPKGEPVNLQGTLELPNRDVDAVCIFQTNTLFLGGGFDVTELYGGDYPSFLGRYNLKYNNKTEVLSISQDNLIHSKFGNKLRSLKNNKGFIYGSGGGNSGIIFAIDEETNNLIKHDSNETEGLFILDTSLEIRSNIYYFVATAYNNTTKELKAFSYIISKDTNKVTLNYEVSLGTFDLNVEAKHSLALPRKNVLVVSLGSGGIGVFNLINDGVNTKAELSHQLKDEILDSTKPNHVVNSFTFSSDVFYVAAGEAGIYIIPYISNLSKLDENFYHIDSKPGVSINSIGKSEDELVVATTEGVSIYSIDN